MAARSCQPTSTEPDPHTGTIELCQPSPPFVPRPVPLAATRLNSYNKAAEQHLPHTGNRLRMELPQSATTPSDESLMGRFQQRLDEAAIDELVSRYLRRGVAVARQILWDRSLAHDAVQEAFVRLIRSRVTAAAKSNPGPPALAAANRENTAQPARSPRPPWKESTCWIQ